MEKNKGKVLAYFLTKLLDDGKEITVKQLQKMLREGELLQYLVDEFGMPNPWTKQDLNILSDDLQEFDYSDGAEEKYGLSYDSNGLAALLCMIINAL